MATSTTMKTHFHYETEMISTNLLVQCCLKFPEHYNSATKHITNSPPLLKIYNNNNKKIKNKNKKTKGVLDNQGHCTKSKMGKIENLKSNRSNSFSYNTV